MKKIPLGGGKFALVDEYDYEMVSKFKWRAKGHRYAFATIHLHQLIMGKPPEGKVIDHKDRNTLDNRRANLRFATHSQNRANRGKIPNTSTGYIGVSLHHVRGSYQAYIKTKGKYFYLGYYKDAHLAALMRDFWATELHGEFAMTNFKVVSQWTNPKA